MAKAKKQLPKRKSKKSSNKNLKRQQKNSQIINKLSK
jgi:hypothetical protein